MSRRAASAAKANPELAAALGSDYLTKPDALRERISRHRAERSTPPSL